MQLYEEFISQCQVFDSLLAAIVVVTQGVATTKMSARRLGTVFEANIIFSILPPIGSLLEYMNPALFETLRELPPMGITGK